MPLHPSVLKSSGKVANTAVVSESADCVERFDVIIVDTSGRHKQESELFEEMVAISGAVKPVSYLVVCNSSGS